MDSKKLKSWMDKNNTSVNELAEILSVTYRAVYYWLNGDRDIPDMIDEEVLDMKKKKNGRRKE